MLPLRAAEIAQDRIFLDCARLSVLVLSDADLNRSDSIRGTG